MQTIPNILSGDLVAALRDFSRRSKLVNTNITQWDARVVGWSAPIICQPLPQSLIAQCKIELGGYMPVKYRGLAWEASIHLGSRLSYIPWHNDDTHKVNITVYLHEKWEADYAGYFLYMDTDCIKAVIPVPGLGLVYETPLLHSVALASLNAPLRESLQIFVNEPGGEWQK